MAPSPFKSRDVCTMPSPLRSSKLPCSSSPTLTTVAELRLATQQLPCKSTVVREGLPTMEAGPVRYRASSRPVRVSTLEMELSLSLGTQR